MTLVEVSVWVQGKQLIPMQGLEWLSGAKVDMYSYLHTDRHKPEIFCREFAELLQAVDGRYATNEVN